MTVFIFLTLIFMKSRNKAIKQSKYPYNDTQKRKESLGIISFYSFLQLHEILI